MSAIPGIDGTHDPSLRSWVDSAAGTHFPIQNLPFGVFRQRDAAEPPRVGVAIGDYVVDVSALAAEGFFPGEARGAAEACAAPSLNPLMSIGRPGVAALRGRLSELLRAGNDELRGQAGLVRQALVRMQDAQLLLPADVGDYTDFYASIDHATRVGQLFRPDNPLLPNYRWVPIAYHGRSSSLVVSGTPVQRPCGQAKGADAEVPVFGASKRLDYELEVGCLIGPGNSLGAPIPIDEAENHIFGICLVNDWSARDIQAWEYQPLGPFLAKSFATSVSPWVVTLEALAPYRVPARSRGRDEPRALAYLSSEENEARGGIDLIVEVFLRSRLMRAQQIEPVCLSRGRFRDLYWTVAQMVAHHTSNGCNLRPGDLLASGTVSGPQRDMAGCLLELTRGGADPIELPTGERRTFLEDGDEVILRGHCEAEGRVRIGLGECRGVVERSA